MRVEESRHKLASLQEQLKAQSLDLQKEDIQRIKDALGQGSPDEIERLKKENSNLRKLLTRGGTEEIRVSERCFPGFSVIGNDIDVWTEKTSMNIRQCMKNCRENQPVNEYILTNPPNGFICQCCGCGVGDHRRSSQCYVCRLLDLSDATLLP